MLISNDWDGLPDEILKIQHDFVVDIKTLILVNYDLTVQAIEGEECKALNCEVGPSDYDYDSARSIINSIVNSHEELRVAARNLAVVGLVTRFQNWLETFVSKQKLTTVKDKKAGRVVKLLNALNGRFGTVLYPSNSSKELWMYGTLLFTQTLRRNGTWRRP